MTGVTEEVRCPSCGGAQETGPGEHYECRFCLTPFTYRGAQEAQQRLVEEIRAWVEQRVGGSGGEGTGGIDASSRAYLFRRNLLPSLQTAHDRAMEATLGYQRFPLLSGLRGNGATSGNPLDRERGELQPIKTLRARMASPDVGNFVMTDDDRATIRRLDMELQVVQGLSNVVSAVAEGTARGYAAARNSFEVLLEEADLHPATADRFRALAELAGMLERALDAQSLSGTAMAEEADRLAATLAEVAGRLGQVDNVGVETSLSSVAALKEAEHARDLARWLRAYDAVVRRVDLPFSAFVAEAAELLGVRADDNADRVVESCAQVQRAVRGEVPVLVHDRFDWTAPLAEGERKGKWLAMIGLGFLGLTESVGSVEELYVPFWLLEAGGSRWLVDACQVTSEPVLRLDDGWRDVALGSPSVLRRPLPVPAPGIGAEAAEQRVRSALRSAGSHNAEVSDARLALLPAARIEYERKGRTTRVRLALLEDRLALGDAVNGRLATARRLQERFG